MQNLKRPPTKKMISQLLRARRIEISQNERNICLTSDFNGSMPGLYKRGLINTKWVKFEGKEVLRVYLTQSGITFLEEYEKTKLNGKQKSKAR